MKKVVNFFMNEFGYEDVINYALLLILVVVSVECFFREFFILASMSVFISGIVGGGVIFARLYEAERKNSKRLSRALDDAKPSMRSPSVDEISPELELISMINRHMDHKSFN